MIRQAIFEFRNERIIIKYIYIVDKLLKTIGFQNAVINYIVEIYCEVFFNLFQQKCLKDIEKLKILRKYWVGTLHPILLKRMK